MIGISCVCAYWGYREIVLTCSIYQVLSASLYKLEKGCFFVSLFFWCVCVLLFLVGGGGVLQE